MSFLRIVSLAVALGISLGGSAAIIFYVVVSPIVEKLERIIDRASSIFGLP